jgi:hypothetical protein
MAGCRIEDLRDQFAHHSSAASKKIVHLSENEAGDDDRGSGDQNLLIFGKL